MRIGQRLKRELRADLPLLILLFLVVAFFWALSKKHSYLSLGNIGYILNSMVIYTLFAVGGGLVIIFGEIDLAPGYIGTAAGTLMAVLLNKTGLPWYVVMLCGIVLGGAFGLLNAFLINEWKIQSFIATLATGSFLAAGFAYIVAGGITYEIKDAAVIWLGTKKIFGFLNVSVILAFLVILIYGIALAKTPFGRSIYLCGESKKASRLVGINPKRLSYLLFANSGMLGALAGMLYDARQCAGNLTGTNHYVFPSVTAAILGGLALGGGKGDMFGCFLGLLIVSCFNNGLSVLGVSPYWQNVASGVLLLITLTISYFMNFQRKKKKQGGDVVGKTA